MDNRQGVVPSSRVPGQPLRRGLAPKAWSGSRFHSRDLHLRASERAPFGLPRMGVSIDDRNTLALLCRRMLEELLSMAGHLGMGLQELEGELRTETGVVSIEIRLVEPTQDDRHLAQLVELQLERRTWTGGIVAVRWTALELGRSEQAQGTWFLDEAETRASRAFKSLVERLSSRLDPGRFWAWRWFPTPSLSTRSGLFPWMNLKPREPGGFTLSPEQSRARPFRLSGVLSRLKWLRSFPMDHRCEWSGNKRIAGWSVPGGRSESRQAGGAPRRRTRLLPRRMGGRRTRMDLSRPAQRPLVPPWLLRLTRHARTAAFQTLCAGTGAGPAPHYSAPVRYVELHCKTNFSFLEGASHPNELVAQAASLGYAGMAVTDRNSLAGAVRAHIAAKEVGLKLLIGAEITLIDAGPILLWAMNRDGYGRLCRLLTRGRRQAPKGECHLAFADVAEHASGLLAGVLLPPSDPDSSQPAEVARRLP